MPEQINENDFALVIGINDYPDWNNGKLNLKGPVKDANEFSGWLKDPKKGGGLPDENIVIVTSKEDDVDYPRPDLSDINRALRRINRTRYKKNDDPSIRRLYIFFSGHGHTERTRPRDSNLCMAPFNEFDGLGEAISLDDILNQTIKCIAPEELVIFLDCCRSLITNAAGADTGFLCSNIAETAGKVKLAILYGTQNYELSYESGDQVRGHFSKALMEGLRGGAVQGGKITLESLYNYLNVEVPKLSDNPRHNQEVDQLSSSTDLKDIILGPEKLLDDTASDQKPDAGSENNVIIRFGAERNGEIILENGLLEIVHQADAGTAPWELSLTRGLYTLKEAANDQEFFTFPVRVVEEKQEVTF